MKQINFLSFYLSIFLFRISTYDCCRNFVSNCKFIALFCNFMLIISEISYNISSSLSNIIGLSQSKSLLNSNLLFLITDLEFFYLCLFCNSYVQSSFYLTYICSVTIFTIQLINYILVKTYQ